MPDLSNLVMKFLNLRGNGPPLWLKFSNYWFTGLLRGPSTRNVDFAVCVSVRLFRDFLHCRLVLMNLRFELYIGMLLCRLKYGLAESSVGGATPKKLVFAEKLSHLTVLIGSSYLLDMFYFIAIQYFSRAACRSLIYLRQYDVVKDRTEIFWYSGTSLF